MKSFSYRDTVQQHQRWSLERLKHGREGGGAAAAAVQHRRKTFSSSAFWRRRWEEEAGKTGPGPRGGGLLPRFGILRPAFPFVALVFCTRSHSWLGKSKSV
ncbi:hypothetical protein NL676_025007 [Syzygium grande]|nr:hypothetical protein NL676_025007 [Syzygium grande]